MTRRAGCRANFTMADGTVVNFTEIENIICFTPGTRILTETGERPVESLRPGDRVITRDHGAQPVRWIGKSTVPGRGRFAPVRVASHVIGARRDLVVSPQHRLLFEGYECELLFGTDEVLLAAARHLEDGCNVLRQDRALVTYIHLMFDAHEVIYAEGPRPRALCRRHGVECDFRAGPRRAVRRLPELRSTPAPTGTPHASACGRMKPSY